MTYSGGVLESDDSPWRESRAEPPVVTASDAGAAALRQTAGGRLLTIEPVDRGYRVRVLATKGQVRELFIPARGNSPATGNAASAASP